MPEMSAGDEENGGRADTEQLTPRAIGRAVLAETVQHPMTILPAAMAGVSALWMLLIDLNPTAFALGFGSSLLSLGSWIFNYFIRGETIARRIVEKRSRQRREQRVASMRSLEQECAAIGFADGASQAREIREEYSRLEQLLRGQAAASGPGVSRLLVLAEDTYREAMGLVRRAYDIYRALDAVDVGKLRKELSRWQRDQQRLERKLGATAAAADQRFQALQIRIDGHQRTLVIFAERHGSVDHLLAESEKLESILRSTHLELVELRGSDPVVVEGDAAGALERAVEAARRVEQRLREAEAPVNEDESIYLEAGRSAGRPGREKDSGLQME